MVSKTISVTEKVYNLLKRMKLHNESFGDTIERLCNNYTGQNLADWIENNKGWEDMTDAEYNEYMDSIKKIQKELIPRKVDFQ